jgi:hypothetical protein
LGASVLKRPPKQTPPDCTFRGGLTRAGNCGLVRGSTRLFTLVVRPACVVQWQLPTITSTARLTCALRAPVHGCDGPWQDAHPPQACCGQTAGFGLGARGSRSMQRRVRPGCLRDSTSNRGPWARPDNSTIFKRSIRFCSPTFEPVPTSVQNDVDNVG